MAHAKSRIEALSEVITSPDAVAWLCFMSTRLTYGKIIKTDAFNQFQLASCIFNTLSNLHAGCQSTVLSEVIQLHRRQRFSIPSGRTQKHTELCVTMWQWFTVKRFARWQWVNRKVHRSSSVTETINIRQQLGFSLRRLQAMMWCSVASPLPEKKGKFPLIYLLKWCFQRTFIQSLKLQTEFCSLYTQGSITVQSHLTAAHTQPISEHPH